jgi:hypothetical protein
MTTKLGIFNGALRLCKERKLASLTENREPRRLLDDAWGDITTTGAVRLCLEFGQWTFATRTQRLDYSPSVEPDFGFRRAFDQPDDMVDVCAVCSDEYLRQPLLRYADERHYWYADLDEIYVSYVSSHSSYGGDLSLWPETFVKLVEAQLADEICGNLTGADSQRVAKALKDAKRDARSGDAMRKPTRFPPEGAWNMSRRWGSSGWDRGSRSRLIG